MIIAGKSERECYCVLYSTARLIARRWKERKCVMMMIVMTMYDTAAALLG